MASPFPFFQTFHPFTSCPQTKYPATDTDVQSTSWARVTEPSPNAFLWLIHELVLVEVNGASFEPAFRTNFPLCDSITPLNFAIPFWLFPS